MLAVVLAAAPTAASTIPASTGQIAVGVSELPFDSSSTYDSYASTMGKNPAVWSVWADWGQAANPSAFPTALVDRLASHGTVPLIFWQPVGSGRPPGHPSSPPLQEACGTDYSKIQGGDWDIYIHQWANAAKGHGPILIRFAHEMDGNWYPYGVGHCTNTALKFRSMWRHVVGIFRADGATNVKFVWSPGRPVLAAKALYPSSTWVDYVGMTAYNWSQTKGVAWASLNASVSKSTAGLLTYAADKPWIVAETGAPDEAGQDRAAWITQGYDAVYRTIPNVKLIVYFDVDMRARAHHQPNWQLYRSSEINAYTSMLNDVRFQGTIH